MTDEERVESFLAGFAPVAPPAGACERILAPALAAADIVDRRRERPERRAGVLERWIRVLLEPVKAAVLAGALLAANAAADAAAPALTRHELTAAPRVAARAPGRWWLADPSVLPALPVGPGREVAP